MFKRINEYVIPEEENNENESIDRGYESDEELSNSPKKKEENISYSKMQTKKHTDEDPEPK
jgi:hypothetical protein